MNDDLTSLRLLLARAENERDAALAEKLRLEAARRATCAQHEQLVVYRREYEKRWSAEFCREGKIDLVRCYQGFIERLSQAVDYQEGVARHAAGQAESATALVRSHELRAAALKKVIERRLRLGHGQAARLEQKQSDEISARAAWVRMAAT